jgi:threonine dehydratase
VTVAALRSGQVRPEPDETVVVVVCGGNTKGPPRG